MKTVTETAIEATLAALAESLQKAATQAAEAAEAMRGGKQNLAIGTALDLEKLLPEANALYTAAVTMHRNSPRD